MFTSKTAAVKVDIRNVTKQACIINDRMLPLEKRHTQKSAAPVISDLLAIYRLLAETIPFDFHAK